MQDMFEGPLDIHTCLVYWDRLLRLWHKLLHSICMPSL